MKKLIALLLVLAMLCCGMALAETDVTGLWYADVFGMVVTLTVNEDSTVVMDIAGLDETTEGVWEVEGDIFYLDRGLEDETTLNINADGTMSDAEGMMVFGRDPIEAVVLPAPVAASDISDFNGTWNASIMDAFGMTLDMESAMEQGLGELLGTEDSSDLTMVIENGKATVFGSAEQEFNFADGQLQIAFDDEEMASFNQYIRLTEDGGVMYELMGMYIYFTKAE